MKGLEAVRRSRNDHIPLIPSVNHILNQLVIEKRHVGSKTETGVTPGVLESRVESSECPPARDQVWDNPCIIRLKPFGIVRHNDKVVEDSLQDPINPLKKGYAPDLEKQFVPSHSVAFPASENNSGHSTPPDSVSGIV